MKSAFESVQQEFMRLSSLLSQVDFEENLLSFAQLAQINDALTDTYILLNQGFCENVTLCKKCIDNRNQLRKLCEVIDVCEEKKSISDDAMLSLEKFTHTIPEILNKMESVYLESLNTVHA